MSTLELESEHDWREYIDSATGRPYYHSDRLRRTSWNAPAKFVRAGTPPSRRSPEASATQKRKTVTGKCGEWYRVRDTLSGDEYFVHRPTKATQWEAPADWMEDAVVPAISRTKSGTHSSFHDMSSPLPSPVPRNGGNGAWSQPQAVEPLQLASFPTLVELPYPPAYVLCNIYIILFRMIS